MRILEAKNLTKQFKNFTAVSGVDLHLDEGEILGLLGPNGAGKTTTLQMLLGVMKPSAGEVNYFGKDLWKYKSEIMEQVNFSSTYVDLPWDLKIHEVLHYVSHLYKIADRRKRIEELKVQFRLKEIWNKQVKDLSAGQLTRLNLAKSFMNKPKILLLDEPTASLDPEIAAYIREIILRMNKEDGMSIVITSHNMAEVSQLCDRVVFINHGKVVANDTPENLARTLKNAKLSLMFDEPAKAEALLQDYKLKVTAKWIELDIAESEIAKLLGKLADNKIMFNEIEIQKPSLEDYFLELAKSEPA